LYQDLGSRETETTHQQQVSQCESHGYWMCCWWVASASIHACIHAGGGHFEALSTRCNKDDVMW